MSWNRYRYSKYGAVKTTYDGITFDSKLEANRYLELKALESKGFISGLELQKEFELQPKFRDNQGKLQRPIKYIADFVYYDEEGNYIAEDTKGFETPEFKIKKKMFLFKYPDVKFIMTKNI